MPALYNVCDVLFFPSLQEIAAMVIIEAAACGLPLVLRDLPEYKEFYGGGYLAGRNLESFISLIKKLSENRDFYIKKSHESILLAARFNSDSIGSRMLDFYSSLIYKKLISQ